MKTDSVSKQESDNAAGDYEAKQAALQSAQANVKRLEELQSFQRIYAPFSGVITARNTDIGALINSGSTGGNGNELFHIAQPDKLRVYVSVPQVYSQAAKPGTHCRPDPGGVSRTPLPGQAGTDSECDRSHIAHLAG